jgi:hypothetical protein
MNAILWGERVQAFTPSEWGALSSFANLQDKLLKATLISLTASLSDLSPVLSVLESHVSSLRTAIAAIDGSQAFISMKATNVGAFLQGLVTAYESELELRRRIYADLQNHVFDAAPYDVIVTVTALWSGRPCTNARAIGHFERFVEFEAA